MMIRRTPTSATVRLARYALLTAINGSSASCVSRSQSRLYSSIATRPEIYAGYRPYFLHSGSIGHNRSSSSVLRLYSTAVNPSQLNNKDYTEMAWEGIVGAVDEAQGSKQQTVESEHLMKALLEQKDGLARRILTKAGLDNSSVLQAIDNFIAQQPKVTDTGSPVLGSHLSSLLKNARKYKKEMEDDFVSVEHLVLAFPSDKRFGKQLFTNLQIRKKSLKDAVQAVCGSQRVNDQNPEADCKALEKYGNDLTELARRGKLDPVIGRDDEILNCIVTLTLSRRRKHDPLIIGKPGVGNTAIAEGLAQRIVRGDVPEPLMNLKLINLNVDSLLAGAKSRDVKERIDAVFKEVTASNGQIVQFADEIDFVVKCRVEDAFFVF